MIISKSENGFIIENKEKNTISFNTKEISDINIFSFEKKDGKNVYFDQEGEYEAFGVEVTGYDLGENLNAGFVVKTDEKKVFLLDGKVSGFDEKILGKIDEIDVLLVNIPENFNNIDLVKSISEKISAKTIIFSGDREKIKQKFEKLENGDEKVKIGVNPENTEFLFI
ncbi:hypothetical protein LR002_03270 [Candidatus Gracilibacteria bacterium]|nr:hypothetical protein [Candidatus Gracilibacteria bacterium]